MNWNESKLTRYNLRWYISTITSNNLYKYEFKHDLKSIVVDITIEYLELILINVLFMKKNFNYHNSIMFITWECILVKRNVENTK